MTAMAPVYLVDDDASLRKSIRFLLSNHGRETRTFDCGETFLAEHDRLEPGPVLLDVQMKGRNGLDVLKDLASLGSKMPVIMITGHGDIAMAVRAMRDGALDFLTKPFSSAELLKTITLADDQLRDHHAILIHRESARIHLKALTPRELQVLNELARGLPNKTIGYDLGISARTVEIHRANLMKKLDVRNFPDALRYAFNAGLPLPINLLEQMILQTDHGQGRSEEPQDKNAGEQIPLI